MEKAKKERKKERKIGPGYSLKEKRAKREKRKNKTKKI